MGKKTVTLPADHARKINKIENEMDSNKMISLERRINSKHPPQQQAILKNQYDDRNKKLQPITQIKKKTKRSRLSNTSKILSMQFRVFKLSR